MPRYISPQAQYFDSIGVPLNGGKLFFYEPSTLVLKNTYSDVALTIPNTNPIILAASGSPVVDIWMDGVYRVILRDANDNVIWDKDPVGGDSGSLIAYSDWVNGIDYPVGEIVTGSNGRYYVSILNPNIANDPITSPVYWTETRLFKVYNANETYPVGVVVQDAAGNLWRAKALTAGSAPAIGSAFWEPAIDGLSQYVKRQFTEVTSSRAITLDESPCFVNGSYTVTLPGSVGLAVGRAIYIAKPFTAVVVVQAGAGPALIEQGRIAVTFTEATFTIDINAGFWFIFNGTNWVAQ